MRFSIALDGYLIAKQSENLSAKTLSMARWHLTKFARWLDRDPLELESLKPLDVRGYLVFQRERGLSALWWLHRSSKPIFERFQRSRHPTIVMMSEIPI